VDDIFHRRREDQAADMLCYLDAAYYFVANMKISVLLLAACLLFVSTSEAWHITLWGKTGKVYNEGGESEGRCHMMNPSESDRLGKVFRVYFNPHTRFATDPREVVFKSGQYCDGKTIASTDRKGRVQINPSHQGVVCSFELWYPKGDKEFGLWGRKRKREELSQEVAGEQDG
jgi:hypothetical protein